MQTMTIEDLSKLAGVSEDIAAVWVSALNNTMDRFGISTPLRRAHFIAQIGHESNGFTALKENLNYSVEGLLKTFGRHRISEGAAIEYGRSQGKAANQEDIANEIYGGDWGRKNLGNTQKGDGFRYLGRGLIQLTGKANYQAAENSLKLDLVNRPERVSEDNLIATLVACWFWQTKGLNELADTDDLEAVTRRVNGALNGLEDRRKRLKRAKAFYGI